MYQQNETRFPSTFNPKRGPNKMRTIDVKKTLAYAVAFYFTTSGKIDFRMGKKTYQYINTVYDVREDGRGTNAVVVLYDYRAQKYVAFNVDDEKIGNQEICFY